MARKLPRFLTPAEMEAMFAKASDSERNLLLLKCMFYLGMRNGEVQSLRIDDIDLINKMVKVVKGKGRKDRHVPIPTDELIADIKAYIQDKREGGLFDISDRQIRRIVKQYARAAGIRKADEVHPHTLRHSYATHLQNQGVPLNVIQQILGHERIETTTVYVHLGLERMREHVEKAFSDNKNIR